MGPLFGSSLVTGDSMPSIITLEVQSATLASEFGAHTGLNEGKWRLSLRVKLPWRERLELGTGEKLDEMKMHLIFSETTPEHVAWAEERTKDVPDLFRRLGTAREEKVVGLMSYHPEWVDKAGLDSSPASISFEVYAPAGVMASLTAFALQGRFPRHLRVDVAGLEYGYAPDGSEKKWLNNGELPMLPITSVHYTLPLLEELDGADALVPGEPTTPVGADLAPLLREAVKWLKWAVYLLALTAGAVVLRNWR